MTLRLISPKQVNYARALIGDRLVTLGFASVDEAATKMNLEALPIGDASTIIDRLRALPIDPDPTIPQVVLSAPKWGRGNRPGSCVTCGHTVATDEGFYLLTGEGKWGVHHKVDECDTSPPPTRVAVTEGFYLTVDGDVVQVYTTKNGRLAGKLLTEQGAFEYQSGLIRNAETGTRLTPEQVANAVCIKKFGAPIGSPELLEMAKRHSVARGNCMFCAKALDDPRSNPALGGAGYGPTCAQKYGLPWGK